jgi:hypothetical protein
MRIPPAFMRRRFLSLDFMNFEVLKKELEPDFKCNTFKRKQ